MQEYQHIRVMPSLLLQCNDGYGGLYKTTQFQNPSYVGDPINAVKIFNDKGVDELILLDINASRHGLAPNFTIIGDIVSEAFMPIAYGGGISHIDHALTLIGLGVEKVILNQALFTNPQLCENIAQKIGSQSLVAMVNIKKSLFGGYGLYNYLTKKAQNTDFEAYFKQLEAMGVGEICVNSVDKDGMLNGFDVNLIEKMAKFINAPLIASGGGNDIENMQLAIKKGAQALALGAKFVYMGKHRAVMINYLNPDESKLINATM